MSEEDHVFDALVIGAGQAGLAAGYHLTGRKLRFAILESAGRVGDQWRSRWDSLRLFTPAQHDGLPGLPFPAGRNTFPAKEEVAAYLEGYAEHFNLPVRTDTHVTTVRRMDDGFDVATDSGTLRARNIIVAAGANTLPRIPAASKDINPGISQLHSSQYRRPTDLPEGDVLVVGAGTSGAEIARELAATHRTFIAGRPTPHIPDPVLRYAGDAYWRFIHSALTTGSPAGRKVAANFHKRGAPLIRISVKDLDRAGVVRLPRLSGTMDGQPTFDGDTSASAETVGVRTLIWATGYRASLGWIEGLPVTEGGWPVTRRGVVPELPGLYFAGMPFQYALTSGLIGGVDRDAAFVVGHLARATGLPGQKLSAGKEE
ncbi:potassium transporter Trk [Arthrobacter sp. Leaf141]|uniref:flavin-containing monooxygenase n=1 Tax=Micrococcaceae TaxID=1268 RepID=UPI0006F82F46|nr:MULTISPECIES: NAD(P)/FAD-dependent oxidoreductase [Micrococcaceae]KQR00004.1 potassium transporter Trk [Arthrobacter sp. Leaf141]